MSARVSIVGTLTFMLCGPIIWALHLLVTYAGHAGFCAVGSAQPATKAMLPLVLGITTVAAAVALAAIAIWPATAGRLLRAVPPTHPEAGFAAHVARLLAALSLLGVLFSGVAELVLPLCAQLR